MTDEAPWARYLVGDALEVLRSMPDESADCLITSPPYAWQRAYLPDDHPDKALEVGQENDPGEALQALLDLMDECHRVLTRDATFWVVLGNSHAGSGGAGGDYNPGGLREGQNAFDGSASKARRLDPEATDRPRQARNRWRDPNAAPNRRRDRVQDTELGILPAYSGGHWRGQRSGWPMEQSICWLPELFGASLAYGRNLLTGQPCKIWVTRPPVTWCKPSPPVGDLRRRFRTATELIIYGGKHQGHFFDLDAVRVQPQYGYEFDERVVPTLREVPGQRQRKTNGTKDGKRVNCNPMGAPPLNWWVVSTVPYRDSHFAVFPPGLIIRPIEAGCPRRVCLRCKRPVTRVVESRYVNGEQDDSTRHKETGRTNDRDNPPEKGWEREHETVGWDCECAEGPGDCRPGIVLDCFGGSGTTGQVAHGHGRSALLIDLDERNVELARNRLGMFLEVDDTVGVADTTVTVGEEAGDG